MNKAQLVAEVQKSLGADTSKAAAERSIEAVLEGIKKGVNKDKNVQLIGFGTFSSKDRPQREARNPKTGEKLTVAAATVPAFSFGKSFKDAVKASRKAGVS